MLNDISGVADSSCNFDFNLSSSIAQNKLKSLLNSKANVTTTDSQPLTENDKCLAANDLLVSVSTNGADNLSWKFFEQVDTLDHQLRRDESSPPLLLNGGILSSSSVSTSAAAATTNDAITTTTMSATLGMQHINNYTLATQSPQPLALGTSRKSNGYAINGNLVQQSTEILPQTNATSVASSAAPHIDLNSAAKGTAGGVRHLLSQQLQQPPTEGTFVFTSPTSTFKRKKQQQLRKQEEEEAELQQNQQRYEVLHNNNNFHKNGVNVGCYAPSERAVGNDDESAVNHELEDYSNTASSKGSNTSLLRQFGVQQQQQHQQQRVNNTHDPRKVINTSTGVIITDTVVTYASTSALSSIIVGGNGTTVTGNSNGTTTALRSTRTHTLPLITKAVATTAAQASTTSQLPPSTFIAGGVVDLVYDTKCASSSSSAATPKSQLKSKTKSRGCSTTVSTNNIQKPRQASCNPAKMQASSSGGSGTTTTAKGFSNSSLVDDIEMHLGLIGWRKKCLYTLLVLLMLLIIINLGLTLWILKVMEFTTEGMGQLKIVPGGIQLNGQALIMDMLRASSIRSRHGQPISIESSRNFSINTRGADGLLENHLFLGHDKLECIATAFRINDTNGRNLFSVNRNEVTIGAHALRIEGEGGAIFRESIQTPHVRAEPGRELRLESPTRQLDMTAAKDINLQSRAGGIEITALEDVKLSALDGSLRFESSKIFMPNLRTVQMPLPGTPQSREHLHRVFQLCACSNGKLFLAAPHSVCAGDDTTVCR